MPKRKRKGEQDLVTGSQNEQKSGRETSSSNLKVGGKTHATETKASQRPTKTKIMSSTTFSRSHNIKTPARSSQRMPSKSPRRNLKSLLPRPRKPLPTLPTNSAPTLIQLHQHATILSALHARHRNQHRAQRWFKGIGMLLRGVRELLSLEMELHSLRDEISGGLVGQGEGKGKGKGKEMGKGTITAEEVRKRFEWEGEMMRKKEVVEKWVREVLVPECYVNFSALVADGEQWAALGLVLVGVVAGVGAVVGLPTEREELEGSGDVNMAETREMRDAVRAESLVNGRRGEDDAGDSAEMEVEADGDGDDIGIVIDRKSVLKSRPAVVESSSKAKAQGQDEDEDIPRPLSTTKGVQQKQHRTTQPLSPRAQASPAQMKYKPSTTPEQRGKKKAKKRRNAIDDLFADLT